MSKFPVFKELSPVLIGILIIAVLFLAISLKFKINHQPVIRQENIKCEDTFHDYYMRYPYVKHTFHID